MPAAACLSGLNPSHTFGAGPSRSRRPRAATVLKDRLLLSFIRCKDILFPVS